MEPMSRRRLFVGSAAALVVGGFDPVSRAWVSVARADCDDDDRRHPRIPRLDGELVFDAASIAEGADDFGHIIHRSSWAVLRPASVGDIVAMIRFAKRYEIPVAMRGQAHSVFGQAQADGGVVIDSRTLDAIHSIDASGAFVDAGVKWEDLVTEAVALGLTPPVLTDYLGLSVGGVLSVGGIGGATHRQGMVVDNCLELTVVTGEGDVVTCSASQRPRLFRSVLGGLGQFAIIVQARLRLVPAKPLARVYQLVYGDLPSYLAAHRLLNNADRFDFLQGLVAPSPAGGWQYILQAATWYAPTAPPVDATLLAGLTPLATQIIDLPYIAWSMRVEQFEADWRAAGVWTTPHPWSDLLMPDDAVETFVANTLATITPADVGAGVILLYPFRRSRLTRPFVRTPATETIWLFDILRFTSPDPAVVDALVAANRALLDGAVAVGGKRYPISAVRVRPADWVAHYGAAWPAFVAAKSEFDPENILTPGQGIFRR